MYYTDEHEDYFKPHDEVQWVTKIQHSNGAVSYLKRDSKEDCEDDLSDFAPGRVKIMARVVRYFDWEVHDSN